MHTWHHNYDLCVLVLSYQSSHAHQFTYPCIGQVWWLGATAHGVRLASIRPGLVWLLRSTAPGALLGSTKADQVFLLGRILWRIVSWLANLGLRMSFFLLSLSTVIKSIRFASFTWWLLHWTGVVTEDNCSLCASGKYQTGSGPDLPYSFCSLEFYFLFKHYLSRTEILV